MKCSHVKSARYSYASLESLGCEFEISMYTDVMYCSCRYSLKGLPLFSNDEISSIIVHICVFNARNNFRSYHKANAELLSNSHLKNMRSRQDSNLRGQSPMDFQSIALTTRPRLLGESTRFKEDQTQGQFFHLQAKVHGAKFECFHNYIGLDVSTFGLVKPPAPNRDICCRGRVVKAMDSKSIGLCPHRFESCRQRVLF